MLVNVGMKIKSDYQDPCNFKIQNVNLCIFTYVPNIPDYAYKNAKNYTCIHNP